MNTLMIALVLWTVAGMLAFMIVKVDVDDMKEQPYTSACLLLYFGPVGWLVFVVRIIQIVKGKWVEHD